MRATDLLKQDHDRVHQMFLELERTSDGGRRQELLDQIGDELEIHAQVEEEIFYPAAREVSRRVDDHEAGHQQIRTLLGAAEGLDPASGDFLTRARYLMGAVLNHASQEEANLFLEAGRLGPDALERLGRQIEERKQALKTSLLQRGKRAVKQAAQKVA